MTCYMAALLNGSLITISCYLILVFSLPFSTRIAMAVLSNKGLSMGYSYLVNTGSMICVWKF